MNIDKLKEIWHKNYEVDPDAELDTEIKIHLIEEDERYLAYFGAEDDFDVKIPITDTRDIVEGLKNYLKNDF